ncbi:exonuclease domain-containing protein [Tundrisphaera sp. TA3]|uniref:3'-5' exonuclease n=1 Tax=Tundrisphaera sp. TA3 TaxID=3435775 RepID=UPI003EB6A6A4
MAGPAAEFVAFDLEMTGLSPADDRIVEVGAVRFDAAGVELAAFASLINPGRPSSPAARAIHGIGDEVLAEAPGAEVVLPAFVAFLGDPLRTRLLAHGATLDAGFLGRELIRLGLPLPGHSVVDTLAWSRDRWPALSSYKLGSLATRFGLDPSGPHRALADARRVLGLWRALRDGDPAGEPPLAYPIFDGRLPPPAPESWTGVAGAIERVQDLRIVYEGGSRGPGPRLVTPRGFAHRGGVAYLVAVCHLDDREKEFRLDRVRRFDIIDRIAGGDAGLGG